MSAVTCRFYVSEITYSAGTNASGKVVLQPAYANGANAAWAQATPSGRIELHVNAEGALEMFDKWRLDRKDLHIVMQPVDELE